MKVFHSLFFLCCSIGLFAQNSWKPIDLKDIETQSGQRHITPDVYAAYSIDLAEIKSILAAAPLRFSSSSVSPVRFQLPAVDGTIREYAVEYAPVMDTQLAARYPGIRTFSGRGITDKTETIRFGYSQKGLHAMISSPGKSPVFIDRIFEGNPDLVQIYRKADLKNHHEFTCGVEHEIDERLANDDLGTPEFAGDTQLRTYRLALACTGEYARFHGNTKPAVLAEYNVAMARINGIFEANIGVTMVLINDTDDLIYLNSNTDPYTNSSPNAMINENQTNINQVIGLNGYDVGHVLGTAGGGLASLYGPCNNNRARAMTGLGSPVNDPFYVDYVAHEMGHQYGAFHTQNNNCNRTAGSSIEPGSGSTIMSYANICAPNVQNFADDYFHGSSVLEMVAFSTNGSGNACPTRTSTNNTRPVINYPGRTNPRVPVQTPFILEAEGSDSNGDMVTYCWEQMDAEFATMPPVPGSNNGPSFRSLSPVVEPYRSFPNLNAVYNGTSPTWEVLPSVSRPMSFMCMARDNAPGNGATNEVDVNLTFSASAGPFEVTSQNAAQTLFVGDNVNVTWDVANTNASPVNCATVDIYLADRNGSPFQVLLLADTQNDGQATVQVPNYLTTAGRILVKGHDNVFFNVNGADLRVEEPPVPTFLLAVSETNVALCQGDAQSVTVDLTALNSFNETATLSVSGLPAGVTAAFAPATVTPSGQSALTLTAAPAAIASVSTMVITATSPSVTRTINVALTITQGAPNTPTIISPTDGTTQLNNPIQFDWSNPSSTDSFVVIFATDPGFQNIIGGLTVDTNALSIRGFAPLTVYYWTVVATNACGQSTPSTISAFQTAGEICNSYTTTTIETIPDVAAQVFSTINVADTFVPTSVRVSMDIEHSYIGDLSAGLIHPSDSLSVLFLRPGNPAANFGCEGDDIIATFDDLAAAPYATFENACSLTPPAISGTFQPIQPLATLPALPANGDWRLLIQDDVSDDGGQLNSWTLELCATAPPAPVLALTNTDVTVIFNASENIASANLSINSPTVSLDSIFYYPRTLPQEGTVSINGTPMTLASRFTQREINSGSVVYQHNGGTALTDNFVFDVLTTDGGWLTNQMISFNIIQNTVGVTASVTMPINCNGGLGSIQAAGTGGTAPLEYRLNNGTYRSSPIFANLAAGTYTVTVRDANGFEVTTNALTLTNPPAITISASVVGNQITVNANGGTGTLTYSLDNTTFQASNVFSSLVNGNYTVFVRDANGCLASESVTININALGVGAVLVQGIQCNGQSTGTINASASGGIGPYQYSLNNGPRQSSPLFTGLPAGTYRVTVFDSRNETSLSNSLTLNEPAVITATATQVGYGLDVNASGGTGTLEYSIDGGTSYQMSNRFDNLAPATYTITIRDANGCMTTATGTVVVQQLSGSIAQTGAITCATANNAQITVTANGGFPAYQYSLNNGPTQSSPVFTGLAPGTYTAQITDSFGATIQTTAVTITAPPALTLSLAAANNTLTATGAGGTGMLLYSLNGGTAQGNPVFGNITNSANYTVVVTDANGCQTSAVQTVTAVDAVSSTTEITDFCDASATVTLTAQGGTPPLQYSIDGGATTQASPIFVVTENGGINPYVVDANGFSNTATSSTLTFPDPLVALAEAAGNEITADQEGGQSPFEYSIDGTTFQNDPIFTGLTSATYTITVRDANGCLATTTVVVDIPALALSGAILQQVSCFDGDNGIVELCIEGGIPDYTITWSPQVGNLATANGSCFRNFRINDLPAGNYTVTITDQNGATQMENYVVTQPDVLAFDIVYAQDELTINASGGTPPYQYSIDNGATFQDQNVFNEITPDQYMITVLDANNCQLSVPTDVISSTRESLDFEAFSVAPNPSRGVFVVNAKFETATALDWTIRTIDGALLQRGNWNAQVEHQQQLDLSSQPAGTYLLFLNNQQGSYSHRLVIMK